MKSLRLLGFVPHPNLVLFTFPRLRKIHHLQVERRQRGWNQTLAADKAGLSRREVSEG